VTDINKEILAREEQRCAALRAGDAKALEGLLSERLRFAHATALYDDKPTLLSKMESGNIVYKSLSVTEPEVIDLGDTALLISRLTADVLVGGNPRAIDNRTLSVWVKESGTWRLIAYQPTPIPK